MNNIMIFGGTLEGRQLAEYYRNKNIDVTVCVATEYGESLIEESGNLHVKQGRLDSREIAELLGEIKAETVIDATHPYAIKVTENIKKACEAVNQTDSKSEYIRVIRQRSEFSDKLCMYFKNIEEAVSYLNTVEGNILLTTGSKELSAYSAIKNREERVFPRVLPLPEVVEQVSKLGYKGKNLICMQGPFSEELNLAMIKDLNIRFLVTKDTGVNGGFPQKLAAAEKAGIKVIIIGRPDEDEGISLERCKEYIDGKYRLHNNVKKEKRTVNICGMGMGDGKTLTQQALETIRNSEAAIGAKRLLENELFLSKKSFGAVLTDKIIEIIDSNNEINSFVVAMSGDTGFYSGASRLIEALKDRDDLEVNVTCGISSAVYFCSKIKQPWQDVRMHSIHGRKYNFVEAVKREQKAFFLLGGEMGAAEFLNALVQNNLQDVRVCIGENLSYHNEKITWGCAKELINKKFASLAVALVINDRALDYVVTPGLSDESFIRGNVPMTKEEIRAVTISKLRLMRNSVVYDVGAGTGSVSLECAMQAYEGQVFAIEKNIEGCQLIKKNKAKFGITNLQVVEGTAPEDMEGLPMPTHAFIGGSSGNMNEIISSLLNKNPNIRIVINTITLESLAEIMTILKDRGIAEPDIIQLNTAKNKKAGRYNLMVAQNPVYVISFDGGN